MHKIIFLCLFFIKFSVFGQDSTLTYRTSLTGSLSTGSSPFWTTANQNGMIPKTGNYLLGSWGIYKILNEHNPRFLQFQAGLNVIASLSSRNDVFLTDAYIGLKAGAIEVVLGQYNQSTGLTDSTLTMGSVAVSNNARPFPRIQLSTQGFVPLGSQNSPMHIRVTLSEGLLPGTPMNYGAVSNIPRTLFHQQSLYFQYGPSTSKLRIIAGINQQVVWGQYRDIFPRSDTKNLYTYILTAKKLNGNRIGNHFGTYDLALSWRGRQWNYSAYRQSIYDNGSIYAIRNLSDGLTGISMKRRINISNQFQIHSLLLEFLSTSNQRNMWQTGGSVVDNTGNYYNSYLYHNGWFHRGYNIGSPMIPLAEDTSSTLENNIAEITNNNLVKAMHLGFTAGWNHLTVVGKITHSFNKGTRLSPFTSTVPQTAIYLSAKKYFDSFNGFNISFIISSDIGQLYSKSNGISISFTKQGFLNYN